MIDNTHHIKKRQGISKNETLAPLVEEKLYLVTCIPYTQKISIDALCLG